MCISSQTPLLQKDNIYRKLKIPNILTFTFCDFLQSLRIQTYLWLHTGQLYKTQEHADLNSAILLSSEKTNIQISLGIYHSVIPNMFKRWKNMAILDLSLIKKQTQIQVLALKMSKTPSLLPEKYLTHFSEPAKQLNTEGIPEIGHVISTR